MRKLPSIILILGAVLYVSTVDSRENTPANPSEIPSLTITVLENSAYTLNKTVIKLHNGKYIETSGTNDNSQPPYDFIVKLITAAFGDLNNNGISDAAVVLTWDGGGSGTFYYLAAVVNQDGKPLNVSTIHLGDGIDIKSIKISSGTITLELLTHSSRDPMCCPTKKSHYEYKLVQIDKKYKLIR
ncbi:MAG: hypothetical protein VST71_12540 [Nitrospirota bacterium]|nr:hypothetical protein [Nitrospirota bacterium]